MTENTPGTSTDPALGSEGDNDQLPREDTLVDRGVDDLLDEGYSPPDRDPIQSMGGLDPDDETAQQLRAEEPEVWESEPGQAAGESQPDRAGRLEDIDDAGRGTDRFAHDAGVAGGAAGAEEAAVHLEPEYRDENDPVDVFTEPEPDTDDTD
ncbi:DUF5709 domain-containing protein [Pseudactinotalea terrae]|uniref:DUF5709 domain-containing protein n=1 Tax=Pseudactinotalea terrae TaxID=1743262 RepID=UPI0012E1AF30|nr:DUF5709 domain-containing protein [Pseudactinotalea terrae]